jgi:hypothetical protein
MKITFLAFCLSALSLQGFSQVFNREAGIRGGLTSGFTYRQYLDEYLAYEGLLSFRQGGIQFTALRQVTEPESFGISDNLWFVYGYGAHAGFYFSNVYKSMWYHDYYYPQRRLSPVLGIDAYAGLEYRVDEFPITIGLDYKPFFEFSVYQFFRLRLADMAFTVKYRF